MDPSHTSGPKVIEVVGQPQAPRDHEVPAPPQPSSMMEYLLLAAAAAVTMIAREFISGGFIHRRISKDEEANKPVADLKEAKVIAEKAQETIDDVKGILRKLRDKVDSLEEDGNATSKQVDHISISVDRAQEQLKDIREETHDNTRTLAEIAKDVAVIRSKESG